MKKISIITLICSFFSCMTVMGQQTGSNIILGGGIGTLFSEKEAFFVNDYENPWPNRLLSPIVQIFGATDVGPRFRVGAFVEYEKGRYETLYPNAQNKSFNRYNVGFNWMGRVSKTKLHGQLGGYVGFGMINSPEWNKLGGVDVGMMAGPAYEDDKYGANLHVQFGFGRYKGRETPGEVLQKKPEVAV